MAKDESSSDRARRVQSTSMTAGPEQPGGNGSHNRLLEQDIGFVGLGHMGTAMAANLAGAGRRVIAHVRRPDQMDTLTSLGLKPTTDVTKLFDCQIVVSMLPDDAAVRDVVCGHQELGIDGLAMGKNTGGIDIWMSTIDTSLARHLTREA